MNVGGGASIPAQRHAPGVYTNPAWSVGQFGPHVNFNGSTGYITLTPLGDATGFDTPAYSVVALLKTPASWGSTDLHLVWSYSKGTATLPYYSQHLRFGTGAAGTEGKLFFGWNSGGTYRFLLADAPSSTNSWHLITIVYRSGKQQLWDNLSLLKTAAWAGVPTYYSTPVETGKLWAEITKPYRLAMLCFYSRDLSAAEIAQIYNRPFAFFS